jgi:putative component of toxin-antitoxin plasmid stabilization module
LGLDGDALVILLAVGDKSTQVNDIKNAKLRWMNRMEKKNEKKKN